jgi:hypothetical protein
VHEHRVGAREAVGFAALEGLFEAPAGDKGLGPGDDAEVVVVGGVLAAL